MSETPFRVRIEAATEVPDYLEERLDDAMDLLMERAEIGDIVDPAIDLDLDDETLAFTMTVRANAPSEAYEFAVAVIREVLSKAGAAVGPQQVLRSSQDLIPA